MRICVIGDVLLDRDLEGKATRLSPDAPVPVVDEEGSRSRPGGAGLAAMLAARDGHDVELVTVTGADRAGEELRDLIASAGIRLLDLGPVGDTREKIRIRASKRPVVRFDRGGKAAASPPGNRLPAVREAIRRADVLLFSDYGGGLSKSAPIRTLLEGRGERPLVWDPHPRGADPVRGSDLVTPNTSELTDAGEPPNELTLSGLAEPARELRHRLSARSVCVTYGSRGALLVDEDDRAFAAPAEKAEHGDTCGAGDRFASAVTVALGSGMTGPEAVAVGVRCASDFVAAGGAGAVDPPGAASSPAIESGPSDPDRVTGWQSAHTAVAKVRAAGGNVIATGGCFDLVHAGHIETLRAARSLGDCLIVLLNDDDSVRRLKGPGRPVTKAADRAAVIGALGCVDAVVLFPEDTPERALADLRPDCWVKGGDYSAEDLPEASLVEGWGGETVIVPVLGGHSTSRLIEELGRHG